MEGVREHPELAVEQEYFDRAAEHRERRRGRALDPKAGEAGIHPGAAAVIREANKTRAGAMGGPDSPVAFWRFTDDADETFYIGRFPILDMDYEPLVISWKSDQASRFPQSTRDSRLGVDHKRTYTTDGNRIVDIADEWLKAAPDAKSIEFAREPLLRALAQRRDGRLTDIVTTIEQKQDEIMRAPSDGLLVIQGGPGTGKTVIGLQRLSLIAYREELNASDLLFVGPSGGFIQYVGGVLPTLGDEGVTQLTIANLAPIRPRTVHREPADVARIKGDERMAQLLVSAVGDRRSRPDSDATLEFEGTSVTLSAADVGTLIDEIEALGRPHNILREPLRERLMEMIIEASKAESRFQRVPLQPSAIRSDTEFTNLLDRLWPTFSPQEFLRALLSSERRLETHAEGLFSTSEILQIARPQQQRLPDEPWTQADLALLDEIEAIINGHSGFPRYAHIVIDEAQDLSPMQLRAIRRRRSKGITVLGDLAQATGPWAHRSWDEVVQRLGSVDESEVAELTIGYRVPSEVMAVAALVAQSLELPVAIPEPIRAGDEEPLFKRSEAEDLTRTSIEAVRQHLARGLSVGLIVPDGLIKEMAGALRYEKLEFGDGEQTTTRSITLITPVSSKGLEFDAVVVVEPSHVSRKADGGLGELFVALTRTIGSLTVVYADPLPAELRQFADEGIQHPLQDNDPPLSATGSNPADEPATADQIPSTIDLGDSVIDSLVEQVAREVARILTPSAMDTFVAKLIDRLRDRDQ